MYVSSHIPTRHLRPADRYCRLEQVAPYAVAAPRRSAPSPRGIAAVLRALKRHSGGSASRRRSLPALVEA